MDYLYSYHKKPLMQLRNLILFSQKPHFTKTGLKNLGNVCAVAMSWPPGCTNVPTYITN